MIRLGVVIIGRNEGERLRGCLESVVDSGRPVVYVDSGSTDGSVALARALGVEVVVLDLATPFTAARARNAGVEGLLQLAPHVHFVQFVDGDCLVVDGWLDRGLQELEARPDVVVVCGRLRERFPERSIYNRLADLEWDTPIGESDACGGIAMMRLVAFRAVGGFDPSIPTGEEPELCLRLRGQGWKVVRLEADMARHDIAMTRFGQWWMRQCRSGYGSLDVVTRSHDRKTAPFARQVYSARLWTVGWILVTAAAGGLAGSIGGSMAGIWAAGLLSLAPALQSIRIAARVRPRIKDNRVAISYGMLTMIGKWGELIGQIRYLCDLTRGHHARLIEYKHATP
ncbi:glycosyltransferase [Singulisphaera sp. Ch08]|uniref:Glycosyltransferase n=1 Tax=Singulisphaera sp. Ch08 TaxID=3120278 RepID=A0AAU7CE93_9BACT